MPRGECPAHRRVELGQSVSDMCMASALSSVRARAAKGATTPAMNTACSSSTSRIVAGSVRARTNSRITASRRKRRGRPPVGTTIEWSRRRTRVPSAPGWVTATASSTSNVRGRGASRQSTSRSSSSRRSHVHSKAVSSVRWRPSGAARSRVAKSRSSRSASSSRERCRATAAASSRARGSPSRRSQTRAASARSAAEGGAADRLIGAAAARPAVPSRSRNIVTAAASGPSAESGASGNTVSAGSPIGVRDVVSTRSPGAVDRARATTSPTAAPTRSTLSSTSR